MNDEKRSSAAEIHDLEAMEIISNLITYSTVNTIDVFALSEVRRKFMGKNSVEDLCPIGSIGYCRDLHKDNPEHAEEFRFREIYQRDDSFVNKGIGFGDKVVVDTSVQRKTGLVCIQIGDYRSIINKRAEQGWRYVGYIPTKQRGTGHTQELDLIFKKEI